MSDLHDQVLDAADVLMDTAEHEMARAVAAGRYDSASSWIELAHHVAAGVRAVQPEIHPDHADA